MRNLRTKLIIIPAIILAGVFFGSCSSELQRYDDAIRIKPDSVHKYRYNTETDRYRSGNTLRGTVLGAKVIVTPYPCPYPEDTLYSGYIIFLDSMANKKQKELIPFEAIDFIADTIPGLRTRLGARYDSVKIFENFNHPKGSAGLREIPIDTIYNNCNPCNCRDLSMEFPDINLPRIKLECIKRKYSRAFFELKAGYSIFTDKLLSGEEKGRDGWSGEIATGFRFGDEEHYDSPEWNPSWGLGVTFTTGVNIFNAFDGEDFTRPAVLFYGRYQSQNNRFLGFCWRPFIYGQLGMTIDKLSMNLFKINWCDECKKCGGETTYPDLEGQPNVDWSIPISWGLGFGLDIPVTSFMDMSVDFGFRSFAFGETTSALEFIVPTGRRVNMFLMRFGFTF